MLLPALLFPLTFALLPLSLPIRKLNNSPLPTPGPLPRPALPAATLLTPNLLVHALGESNNDICLACPQRQNADTGAGAQGADGGCERRGGEP